VDELLLEGQEGSGQLSPVKRSLVYSNADDIIQLFARRGALPQIDSQESDPWTTFQMTLREPAPIPPAFDFTRFLASSITFMTHLSKVTVFLDGKCLVSLSKNSGRPKEMMMVRGLKGTSPEGTMTVRSIQATRKTDQLPTTCPLIDTIF